jgi:microcin C transport system substrate-binding protein
MQTIVTRRRRPRADRRRILALGALAVASPSFAAKAAAATAPKSPASAPPAPTDAPAEWAHAWAGFGEPKYPKGFEHFDFADPAAKKGGTLYLPNPDRRTSFDKLNYFTLKGNAPGGVQIYMLEALAIPSADEPATIYGLLAEQMLVAPDKSTITFRIHPKATFWNGDPVLAQDVKHSFDILTKTTGVDPDYPSKLACANSATVIDDRTIRFDMKDRTIDAVLTLPTWLFVFSRKWGVDANGHRKPFDEIINEVPITSGPYTIEAAESGRRLVLKLRPDYWARDLGVRRGFFNFDRIVYRYYADRAIAMEAFKAHEYDVILEYSARRWDRVHAGPKWDDGRIKKENMPNGAGMGFASYPLNTRRALFQDRRVREALDWAFDFEWINRLKQYQRIYSLFSNTEFAAKGLPTPGELALLEPFRAQLPPAVFGPAYVPPRMDTSPMAPRENLRRARELFSQAGWNVASDGVMRNAKGEAFAFEYLTPEEGAERTVTVWISNLKKLGIEMKVRRVDYALYHKRTEAFDFDMISVRMPDFTLPLAAVYSDMLGSKAADEPGSGNSRGVKSPAVDALVAAMSRAQTMDQLREACAALDRVVMHEHWQVPYLYGAAHRCSYWNRFEQPKIRPKYYTIDSPNELLPQWPITTWWLKDSERRG